MTVAIQTHLPEDLVLRCRQLVDEGWAADMDEIFSDALRRYLQSHGPALAEAFIREDIEWGLHGRD
jgi:hypothetical protein